MKNALRKFCAILLTVVLLTPAFAVEAHAASYIWPLSSDLNYITSYAGNRIHPLTGEKQNHSGIDIRASKGSSVYATASGTAYVGCDWCSHNYGKSKSCGCGGGYGNYVYIVHSNGMVSYYAHLTSINVYDGQYVSQGKTIGTSGSTGSSTGFHLHFELRTSTSSSDRVDPLDYVSVPGDSNSSVVPEENPYTPSFNPNVIEYYTGLVSNGSLTSSSSNVYDYYVPSAPTGNTVTNDTSAGNSSSISISLTNYPEALKKGESYNLKGTISSKEDISRVMGRIMGADGSTVQTVVVRPNDDTLNVNTSDINRNLRFGSLPEGSYSLLIEVTDEDGGAASWNKPFTVGSAVISEEKNDSSASGIKIDVTRYPTKIYRGNSYSLRGTISSDERVKTINGYILDKNGNTVQSTTDSPNARSVSIQSARVNQKLAFGKLSRGSYTLKIVVTDASGATAAWEKAFTVE